MSERRKRGRTADGAGSERAVRKPPNSGGASIAGPCGFDLLPDDIIIFIVPFLSFSASVALERCNKRLQRILGRTKRERCDAWLLRRVLRVEKAKVDDALALLAKAAKKEEGVEVFHFSSMAPRHGDHIAARASLKETVLAFTERELNLKTEGSEEHLADTVWGKGYWLDEPAGQASEALQAPHGGPVCALSHLPPRRGAEDQDERLHARRYTCGQRDLYKDQSWEEAVTCTWMHTNAALSAALEEEEEETELTACEVLGFEPLCFLYGHYCDYGDSYFTGIAIGKRRELPRWWDKKHKGGRGGK